MGAKPGDVFNGHILGQDNQWHRLAEDEQIEATVPPEAAPVQSMEAVPIQQVVPVPARPVDRIPAHQDEAERRGEPVRSPTYWVRYRRRWFWTALIVGVVCGLAVVIFRTTLDPAQAVPLGMVLDFVFTAIGNGLIFGSLINLLVALYPGAPKESQRPAGQRAARERVRWPAYWVEYRHRWLGTALIVGLVCGLGEVIYLATLDPALVEPLEMLLAFVAVSVGDGLFVGSLINLLVALYPGAPEEIERPTVQRSARPALAAGRPTSAQTCPGCGRTIRPEAWVLHPRYCTGPA